MASNPFYLHQQASQESLSKELYNQPLFDQSPIYDADADFDAMISGPGGLPGPIGYENPYAHVPPSEVPDSVIRTALNQVDDVVLAAQRATSGTLPVTQLGRRTKIGLGIAGGLGVIGLGYSLFSGRGRAYNTIEGFHEQGLTAESRKLNTDFGSGYQGLRIHGQTISQEVQEFREKWYSSDESKAELKRKVALSQSGYGEFPADRIKALGNGKSQVDLSGYKLEWEDADTLLVKQGWFRSDIAIRLTGIDAPEVSSHGDDPTSWYRYNQEQPGGQWALQQVKELTKNSQISLEIASDPKAKTYGRYLGLVYRDKSKKPLNLELVEQGIVAALPFGESGSDIYPREKLMSAERRAYQEGQGIWSEPYFQKYMDLSKGLGGRITFNSFTDLTRLAKNYHLAAAESYLSGPNPVEPGVGRYIGKKLIPSYGRFFSGKDDAYNTLEGLKHGGMAETSRRQHSEFGSGWQGLKKVGQLINPLNWAKNIASSFANKEAKVFGNVSQQYIDDLLKISNKQSTKITFNNDLSVLEAATGNLEDSGIVLSPNSPVSILAHEIGHKMNLPRFPRLVGMGPMFGIGVSMLGGILPTGENDTFGTFGGFAIPVASMLLAGPRLLNEYKASKWGLKALKSLSYPGIEAAKKTLTGAFGTYATQNLGFGILGGLWFSNRSKSAKDHKKPFIDVSSLLRYKADISSVLAGGHIGKRFGTRGAALGMLAGGALAGSGRLIESFLPEGRIKNTFSNTFTALQGGVIGSAIAIASTKGGPLYKIGQKSLNILSSISNHSVRQMNEIAARELGLSLEDAELLGWSNISLTSSIRNLVGGIGAFSKSSAGISGTGRKIEHFVEQKIVDPTTKKETIKKVVYHTSYDASFEKSARDIFIKDIRQGKDTGIGGKISKSLEEMFGSPNFIEELRKYKSVENIPKDIYLKSVTKDLYKGTGTSIVVGLPFGLLFSGKDDNYNTIEGFPEKGFAKKQREEFGSGWLRKVGSSVASFFKGVFGKKTLGIAPHLIAPIAKQSANIESFASQMQSRFGKKLNMRIIIGENDDDVARQMVSAAQENPEGFKQFISQKKPGLTLDESTITHYQQVLGRASKDIEGAAISLGNQNIIFLNKQSIVNRLPGASAATQDIVAKTTLYHEMLETRAKQLGFDQWLDTSHRAEQVVLGEGAFMSQFKDEGQEAIKYFRTGRHTGPNPYEQLRSFDMGFMYGIPTKGKPVNEIEGLMHKGLAQWYRKMMTPFGSKVDALRLAIQSTGRHFEEVIHTPAFKKALELANPVEKISEGLFGVVEKVSFQFEGNTFMAARKRLLPGAKANLEKKVAEGADPSILRGLDIRNEANMLEHLGGEGIIPSLYGKDKDTIFMELMSGKRVTSSNFASGYQFPEHSVKELHQNLKYMADKGVVHPDLHGGNILFDETTQKFALLDFGLAQEIRGTSQSAMEVMKKSISSEVELLRPHFPVYESGESAEVSNRLASAQLSTSKARIARSQKNASEQLLQDQIKQSEYARSAGKGHESRSHSQISLVNTAKLKKRSSR